GRGGAARTVASGGHRDAISYFELCDLAVDRANFRVLDDLGGAIGEKGRHGCTREGDAIVGRAQVSQLLQAEGIGTARRAAGAAVAARAAAEGQRSGRTRGDSEIPYHVRSRLQHRHLDQDFGFGAIQIGDEFLRDRQLGRSVANDDRVHGVDLLYFPEVEQLPEPVRYLGQVLRLDGVRQVEGLNHQIVVVLPFLLLVGKDQDDVFGERLPEGFAFQRDDIERLLEGNVIELDRYAPCRKIGIEDYGQPGLLAYGLEDDFGVVDHLQADRRARERLQLWRLLGISRWAGGRRAVIQVSARTILRGDGLERGRKLLPGRAVGGIERNCLPEFDGRAFQASLCALSSPFGDMRGGRLKSRRRQANSEVGIGWMGFLRAFVIVHGGIEILQVFRFARQLQIVLGFGTPRQRACGGNQKEKLDLAFDAHRTTSPARGVSEQVDWRRGIEHTLALNVDP